MNKSDWYQQSAVKRIMHEENMRVNQELNRYIHRKYADKFLPIDAMIMHHVLADKGVNNGACYTQALIKYENLWERITMRYEQTA